MSKLRDQLDSIFKEHKGDDRKSIEAAAKKTHQKPSTLKIYLWRFKSTGSTGRPVVKKKDARTTWKSDIWNKGKSKAKKKAKVVKGRFRKAEKAVANRTTVVTNATIPVSLNQ